MASENITLYIKGDRNVEVTEQDVFLKDIVSMECSDKNSAETSDSKDTEASWKQRTAVCGLCTGNHCLYPCCVP